MHATTGLGLTAAEASSRLARVGPNRLFTPAPVRFWSIAAEEIREPMILLLIVVGVVYSVLGNLGDAITIFAVILLLVAAEVVNEFRAKRAIGALERLSEPKTRVRRDGRLVLVDTETVVPGDVLILIPGVRIAADATLRGAVTVSVDESTLTGESLAVEKSVGDAIYAGTTVSTGEGEAEVVSTGGATRLGEVAARLRELRRGGNPVASPRNPPQRLGKPRPEGKGVPRGPRPFPGGGGQTGFPVEGEHNPRASESGRSCWARIVASG